MRVYVLLFNARTENEGIHSVQADGHNKVLMFRSEDDATRYALMLEAQDFPQPTVEAIDSDEIEAFCREAGYECETIDEGQLVTPPEQSVDETDWQQANQKQQQPQLQQDTDLDSVRERLEKLL
ncbi:MAG: DUF3110 domain-containing protein [Cyanobacteria bacterium QS_8_64_29]|nr:MAG: DUF3110 domain-containing protein [Cyanobacteria bacterium QS_8_64_29]